MAHALALDVDPRRRYVSVPSVKGGYRRKRRHRVAVDREELLSRLAAGEWLRPGEAAAVLRVSRRTVHNMIADGRLHAEPYLGGKQRVIDPRDLRRCMPPRPNPETDTK